MPFLVLPGKCHTNLQVGGPWRLVCACLGPNSYLLGAVADMKQPRALRLEPSNKDSSFLSSHLHLIRQVDAVSWEAC